MSLSRRTIEICLNYLYADLEVVRYEWRLQNEGSRQNKNLLNRIEQALLEFERAITELEGL